MDTNHRQYNVEIKLTIESVWDQDPPQCEILLDDVMVFDSKIYKSTEIAHQFTAKHGSHKLCIRYQNKSSIDPTQSIQIKSIKLNNIEDPKFIWAGIYCPEYPEPWASQQHGSVLSPTLTNIDYLGWAGTWTLTFGVPVFTWIHNIKNLGTIHD